MKNMPRMAHSKNILYVACRSSSVDLSGHTILPPWVRVPSKPFTLLSFEDKFVLYLSCENNENNQKGAEFGPFFKSLVRNSCYD